MSGSDLVLSGTDPAALAEAAAVEAGRRADIDRQVDEYLRSTGDYAPAVPAGHDLERAERELAEQQQAEADDQGDAMSDSQAALIVRDRLVERLGTDRLPTAEQAAAQDPVIAAWRDADPARFAADFALVQSFASRLPTRLLDEAERAGVLRDHALLSAIADREWARCFSGPRRGAGARRAAAKSGDGAEGTTMASSNLTAAERAMMQRKHLAAVQASDLAFASGDRAGGQRWAQIGDQLAERLWGGERIVDGVRTA